MFVFARSDAGFFCAFNSKQGADKVKDLRVR